MIKSYGKNISKNDGQFAVSFKLSKEQKKKVTRLLPYVFYW